MTKKATAAIMEALHGALATAFQDILDNGKTAVDRDTGEAVKVTPDASTLNAIRQFLKDNGIEAAPGTNSTLGALERKANLPFPIQTDEFGIRQ